MLRVSGAQGFAFLAKDLPGFRLSGSQVQVIHEPSHFYEQLLNRSATAKKRVVLSALYLGVGPKEVELVSRLQGNLAANPQLRVNFLLDCCRGSRMVAGSSSCTLVSRLQEGEGGERCRGHFYHTPKLRGALRKVLPQRWNEIVGLQHCKVYIFDDSVIISGANLSSDYFTDRQDRYVVVENCPGLADYYESYIDSIGRFSFHLDSGQLKPPTDTCHPYLGKLQQFVTEAQTIITSFMNKQKAEHNLEEKLEGEGDTLIYPTVQMGQLGIRQDSEVTSKVLASGEQGGVFHFGSGYFNLTAEYCHQMMHSSKAGFRILMAHPEANGFLGARGPAGGIPHAYTAIARGFWNLLTDRGLQNRIQMVEWQRPEWTFHAKGLWYSPPGEDRPVLTMVGSPNFGYRSVERDLETQMVVVTSNEGLRDRLKEERDALFKFGTPVTAQTWEEAGRAVPWWVARVVGIARNFF